MKWPVQPVLATAKELGGERTLGTGVEIGNEVGLSLLW